MTNDDIETIRTNASRQGDSETTELCGQAIWGETAAKRNRAKRKLVERMGW